MERAVGFCGGDWSVEWHMDFDGNEDRLDLRILVIDSDPISTTLIDEFLDSVHIECVRALSGNEGIEKFASEHFDIVFLDLDMPDVNGLFILKKLKDMDWFVDVVIVTACADAGIIIKVMQSFASDFVMKPVSFDSLRAVLDRAVNRLWKHRELRSDCTRVSNRVGEQLKVISHDQKDLIACAQQTLGIVLEEITSKLEPACSGKALELTGEVVGRIQSAMDILDLAIEKLKALLDKGLRKSSAMDLDRFDDFDLVDTVKRCCEEFVVICAHKDITIDLAVPCGRLIHYGNEEAIFNAMANLLHNAVKYSDSGGRIGLRLERLEAKRDEELGHVKITVEDQGRGMSDEHIARIFEEGFTTASDGECGTGFGLHFVKQIVDTHGGTISVCSGRGAGSCFEVLLPSV